MPRMTRFTPISTPIGMAVTQASRKALNTRYRLTQVCSHKVAPPNPSVATSKKLSTTAPGPGRNNGATMPVAVTYHHAPIITRTVAMLMRTLLPCPGAP